ncbi:anthranilate synthase component I [Hydromonas duriensis]|uniref:anthranilate synthase component I n=1 Tax=Hydromonas duriensis TaxID=1527608 RepID=UPI001B87669E|nr:anthranilate synthase component I [Hydromonas duriensis]
MTQDAFYALAAQGYNHVPLSLETFADLDTPLSIYLKLAHAPYSYLLESVVGGERSGRYSIIGLPCRTRIVQTNQTIELFVDGECTETVQQSDLFAYTRNFLKRFKVPQLDGHARYSGGLVGYFAYDTVREIEPRLKKTTPTDDVHLPDLHLLLSEELAVVDNVLGKVYLTVYANPQESGAYERAALRLKSMLNQLRAPATIPASPRVDNAQARSDYGEAAFKRDVLKCKDYINAGDCMQIVLSQRTQRPFAAEPINLYRALRALNPSPYMYFMNYGDMHVVGASPEILVKLDEAGIATVRPIAGTRPRGMNDAEDDRLSADLLADAKECAEHLMLIDLGRNDIGRIAQVGTVKVTEQMTIEKYSHVLHMVSNVQGQVQNDMDAIDVLKATFPAGTLSGAPKVRAMEILDELEPTKRGVYGGAVGHMGFFNDMDLAIAIRTAVIKNNTLYVQAGAGIVADSDVDAEWNETRAKMRAVLSAADLACDGLDTILPKEGV